VLSRLSFELPRWKAVIPALLLGSVACSANAARSPYYDAIDIVEQGESPLTVGEDAFYYRSGVLWDLDGDGYADPILTISTYPHNEPHPVVVLSGAEGALAITESVFPAGAPWLRHSTQTHVVDYDGDGELDLLFSEAGLDFPPWTGERVGIARGLGGGRFLDVSDSVPSAAKNLRCYAMAAGDLRGDGSVQILLPAQTHPPDSGLLSWRDGGWDFQKDWIAEEIWWAQQLNAGTAMHILDIDGDGHDDLYVSGAWTIPSHRVMWGGEELPLSSPPTTLPEGPYGHNPWEELQITDEPFLTGGDVHHSIFADFTGDGALDLVSIHERVDAYAPGHEPEQEDGVAINSGVVYRELSLQVLQGDGGRTFVDISPSGADAELGRLYYSALFPIDLDQDGDLDLVGHYWNKSFNQPRWGTTLFINDGAGRFDRIDGQDAFPEIWRATSHVNRLGLGAFFPTRIHDDGTDGLFFTVDDRSASNPRLVITRVRLSGRFGG
jgi:hypothetical protein